MVLNCRYARGAGREGGREASGVWFSLLHGWMVEYTMVEASVEQVDEMVEAMGTLVLVVVVVGAPYGDWCG